MNYETKLITDWFTCNSSSSCICYNGCTESTTPEVLRNGNYSEECIRIIQLNKAYANAVPYNEPDPNHIKIGNKFFDTTSDIVRNIFIYLDPSYDDNKFFTRDIRMKTGFEDL